MGRSVKWMAKATAAGVLAMLIAACGNGVPSSLDEARQSLGGALDEVRDWAGRQVGSLEGVNERVASSTQEMLALLGELDYKLSFRENGIGFSNASGVEGVVGVRGNLLVLDVAFPGHNAEAAHAVARILTVFSENGLVEERLAAITNGGGPQTVQLDNGWIRTDGELVSVRLEKALI